MSLLSPATILSRPLLCRGVITSTVLVALLFLSPGGPRVVHTSALPFHDDLVTQDGVVVIENIQQLRCRGNNGEISRGDLIQKSIGYPISREQINYREEIIIKRPKPPNEEHEKRIHPLDAHCHIVRRIIPVDGDGCNVDFQIDGVDVRDVHVDFQIDGFVLRL